MGYFSEKFKNHLKERGLSLYKAALAARLDTSRLWNAVSGNRTPSDSILKALADTPELGLSLETLTEWRIKDKFGVDVKIPSSDESKAEPSPLENIGPPEGFYRFPCKGSVAAGALEYADVAEDIVYYEFADIKEYSTEMFCLKVRGDSMEPLFHDGGVILVKPTKTYKNGKYYVFLTEEGKTTFKCLRLAAEGTYLMPLNPLHEPIKLKGFQAVEAYEVMEYKLTL